MYGRYGYDELSRDLFIAGLIMIALSNIPHLHFFYLLGLALMICLFCRGFSRNIYKRQLERNRYLNFRNKVVQRLRIYNNIWRDRKTHKYYKCPGCKSFVRITRPGKGRRIMVTCPKCRLSFEKRT